jgi:hypothetical protein
MNNVLRYYEGSLGQHTRRPPAPEATSDMGLMATPDARVPRRRTGFAQAASRTRRRSWV